MRQTFPFANPVLRFAPGDNRLPDRHESRLRCIGRAQRWPILDCVAIGGAIAPLLLFRREYYQRLDRWVVPLPQGKGVGAGDSAPCRAKRPFVRKTLRESRRRAFLPP